MKNNKVSQQLLSGATSGLASTVLLQPLDLLKTRAQQNGVPAASNARNTTIIISTARSIISSSGSKGLWRGTTPSLLRNVPGISLYMTSLTQLRTFLASSTYFPSFHSPTSKAGTSALPTLSPTGNLVAGSTTRVLVGFILNPFTVLKTRYESNMYAYTTIPSAFKSLLQSRSLFSGVLVSSLRDAPHAGLFLLFYEGIKGHGSSMVDAKYSTPIHTFSGASAGALATLITQPFDVIKTKIQLASRSPKTPTTTSPLWQTIKSIYTKRGLRGYFDGGGLRISRKIFSSAIGWTVYEKGLKIFLQVGGETTTSS